MGVHLNGYLGNRMQESVDNRILAQDVDGLIAPFKTEHRTETRQWQSEFWGKWLTSAVMAYKYNRNVKLRKALDKAVTGLLATQAPDGYIGNYADAHRLEEWDIWGRKYCMLGLLDYYGATWDKKSLNGAKKIADNLISELNKKDGLIVNKGNYRGMAASSVLEPICLLYNCTNNKKYLNFALEIVRQWETPDGPQLISKANVNVSERFPRPKNWYSPEQGQKAYEMMSCYEGLLELYRITRNPAYKKAVEDVWANIRDTEINIAGSGASTEMWFGGKALQSTPINHYQETCVTVTWLKLCGQLLRLTGEAKYADEAERTYYNALLGSMNGHGANWAKYTPLNGQRLAGSEQCGMGLNCCEASGPRGLFTILPQMVTGTSKGVAINYFADGAFTLKPVNGSEITFNQHTTYPRSGTVEIELTANEPEEMEIAIRIPAWSKNTRLSVNGEAITNLQPGTNAKIKRKWSNGDKILLELDMRGRVIETLTPAHSIAIMRGPIVLARDVRFGGPAIEAVLKPVKEAGGYIVLSEVPNTTGDDILMLYKAGFIPESYTENGVPPVSVTLCDYASAGNGSVNSFYKVWLAQLVYPSAE
ncbi:hypothetical protein EPL05_16205 [Mucilaginibacter gilvus]|uniref:Glycoside hydrolase family 127 protein n=2 Tax=Mucilaginibacter gilvus TaxID=2305909 RepID=A0A444MMA0_9SPHI|nr:hypothetical protein EPL05_16205 [Mucilaginibacter gilvus]